MKFLLLLASVSVAAVAECTPPLRLHVDYNTLMPAETAELQWLDTVLREAQCPLQIISSAAATTQRRLNDLRDGQSDVWFGTSKTAARQTFLYFSAPYFVDEVRRYVRKGESDRCYVTDFDALLEQGCRLVGPLTGWYGRAFELFRDRHQSDQRVMYYRHHVQEALRLLRLNRADIIITTKRQMLAVDDTISNEIEYLAPALLDDPLHVVFSKKTVTPAQFEHVNNAIVAALPRLEAVTVKATGQ